ARLELQGNVDAALRADALSAVTSLAEKEAVSGLRHQPLDRPRRRSLRQERLRGGTGDGAQSLGVDEEGEVVRKPGLRPGAMGDHVKIGLGVSAEYLDGGPELLDQLLVAAHGLR